MRAWRRIAGLAALAAMLVYTGTRLASPSELGHARSIGTDQLLLFTVTLVVTLATDLLVGVGVGLALKILLHWLRGASPRTLITTRVERQEVGDEVRLVLHGAAAFPTLLRVRSELESVDPSVRRVVIDLGDAKLADHTFLSRVEAMGAELPNATIEIEGLDRMHASSAHPHATRRRVTQ